MGAVALHGRESNEMKGWQCSECGTQFAYIHFANNPYITIKTGAPCPELFMFRECHGVLFEIPIEEADDETA